MPFPFRHYAVAFSAKSFEWVKILLHESNERLPDSWFPKNFAVPTKEEFKTCKMYVNSNRNDGEYTVN